MSRFLPCFFAAVLTLTIAASFRRGQPAEAATSGKRLFIVLLDETGNPGVENFWKEAVGMAADLVMRMGQDDAYTVIGIDDHAGDPADVRIKLNMLDPNPLKAAGMKPPLAAAVRKLEPRNPKVKNTDILGAVATASQLAYRQDAYRPVLIFLSDMDQYPTPPTVNDVRTNNIAFAAGAEARVFFFNPAEYARRNKLTARIGEQRQVQNWLAVLKAAGLKIEEKDFVPPGESGAKFNQLYPPRF